MTSISQDSTLIRLTILLTSYNYAHYILEALARILTQMEPEFELLIIDDGSTDNTIELVGPLVEGNPAVRLIRNEKNSGIHEVLNKGLALARGDYFICASADDHALPGVFRKSLDLLLRHPQAAFCTAPIDQMDEQGRWAVGWLGPKLSDQAYLGPDEVYKLMRCYGFWFAGATTMFRTDLLRRIGGFSKKLGNLADSFVSQQLALEHGICTLSEILGEARILLQSYSCTERYDLEKTYALRLEAISVMEQSPHLFPEDFIREWVDVWAFLDALKAWHRATIWTQRNFLGPELKYFRHHPGVLDKVFVVLVRGMGLLQFFVFCVWGGLLIGHYRLFRRYLRPERLFTWIKNQIRPTAGCRHASSGR